VDLVAATTAFSSMTKRRRSRFTLRTRSTVASPQRRPV
jgi:hypothetical protein